MVNSNIQNICREYLEKLQSALDASSISEANGVCYSVEDWLTVALAIYANKKDGLTINLQNITLTANNNIGVLDKILADIIMSVDEGKTPEEYYNNVAVPLKKNCTMSHIETVAKNYCKYLGGEYQDLKDAIETGVTQKLSGVLADFAALFVQRKNNYHGTETEDATVDNYTQLCMTAIASFCWTYEAVWSMLVTELGIYFDKWRIGDSEERFPYMIASRKDKITSRNKDSIWKKLEPVIIEAEQRFFYAKGKQYVRKKDGTFHEVMIKNDDKSTKVILDDESKVAISDITSWYQKKGDEFVETFDYQFYADTKDSNSRFGKGSAELMNYVIAQFDNSVFGNEKTFKENLKEYGMGIDCSGFVSRALTDIMMKLKIPYKIQKEVIGAGYDGRLKTNATTLRDSGVKTLFKFRRNDKGKIYFEKGTIEEEPKTGFDKIFQPGDIIMKKKVMSKLDGATVCKTQIEGFHIWIIKEVSEKSFVAYNSAAGKPSLGPIEEPFSKFSHFQTETYITSPVKDTVKIKDKNTKEEKEVPCEYEHLIEFARPKVFLDLKSLATYFVNYLERGE